MGDNAPDTGDDTSQLRRDVERVKSDLRQIRGDVAGLAEDAVHAAKTGAAEARERVDRKVRAAAERGRESVEAIEDQIAAHPFMSVAVAFGVGMIMGCGLSRKD